jgi:GntR family transcriptional regulator
VANPRPRAAAARSIRYREIADALRSRVTGGEFVAGRLLPSEAVLSAAYGVSRVTVRRALEVLRDEGLVDARQGFGWFAAATPVRQVLGRLGTIEEQMAASGLRPERRVLDFAFVAAEGRVAEVLGHGSVLRVRRLNLADGEPFARVTVWCPADLGQHLSRADVERAPFYELLSVPLVAAVQTIGAAAASASDAEVLGIPPGSPVLRCERVTSDGAGRAVLMSVHVFPAHRTEFVVDLAQADRSIAPSGLRLVE